MCFFAGINKNLSQEMSQKLSIANASKPSQMPVESGGLQYAPADGLFFYSLLLKKLIQNERLLYLH